MKKWDTNPSSNTSKEAPNHSKDTILMCNDYKGRNADEMQLPSVSMKNVSGNIGVLTNHKIRI